MDASRHYEVRVRIEELSLPKGFNGVLPWVMIDSRPFLDMRQGIRPVPLAAGTIRRERDRVRPHVVHESNRQSRRSLPHRDDVRNRRAWRPEG